MSFPLHPKSEGMFSFGTPRVKERPPSIWDTQGISGNVFAHPRASSSAPYPQELNQWNSSVEEPLLLTTVEKGERPGRNQDLRCQSGPLAKDSVLFSGGDSSMHYRADQQRLQILDLNFGKFRTLFGRQGLNGPLRIKATVTMTESMESRLSSSGTYSQDSQRCSSAVKSQIY